MLFCEKLLVSKCDEVIESIKIYNFQSLFNNIHINGRTYTFFFFYNHKAKCIKKINLTCKLKTTKKIKSEGNKNLIFILIVIFFSYFISFEQF